MLFSPPEAETGPLETCLMGLSSSPCRCYPASWTSKKKVATLDHFFAFTDKHCICHFWCGTLVMSSSSTGQSLGPPRPQPLYGALWSFFPGLLLLCWSRPLSPQVGINDDIRPLAIFQRPCLSNSHIIVCKLDVVQHILHVQLYVNIYFIQELVFSLSYYTIDNRKINDIW
jgi:hypothetical protein